jgi:hypothetical protein
VIDTHLKTTAEQLMDGDYDPDDAVLDEPLLYDIGDDARKALAETRAWDEGLGEWEGSNS